MFTFRSGKRPECVCLPQPESKAEARQTIPEGQASPTIPKSQGFLVPSGAGRGLKLAGKDKIG